MNPRIHCAASKPERFIDEGCHIVELCNSEEEPELSIARARVEPGVCTRWHRLRATAERYCIVEGRGTVEVGELPPSEVRTGDVVVIPPGVRQRIRNTGARDLIFLAICTPRFQPECYQDLDPLV